MAEPFPPGQRTNLMPVLRVRVGLPSGDASQDAAITAAFNTALALAESYTDRKFEAKLQSETFVHFFGRTLSLIRYPVIAVDAIDESSIYYHIDKNAGLIMLDNMAAHHEITLDYRAGYTDSPDIEYPNVWPDDLMFALLQVFDKVWAVDDEGDEIGSSIKSIRAGELSIGFGSDASDYGANPAFGGMIPVSATLILDLYTRRKA